VESPVAAASMRTFRTRIPALCCGPRRPKVSSTTQTHACVKPSFGLLRTRVGVLNRYGGSTDGQVKRPRKAFFIYEYILGFVEQGKGICRDSVGF